ncbi:MAG: VWA domain-containing protein, partial [Ignavibacteriaceae bacterium]|nr:VWA domain-containing protein [Ignavibacteriaceae bacterium]
MKSLFALLIILTAFTGSQANSIPLNNEKNNSSIQLAILLDTSSSMDGLIDQARSQLWKIVNELASSKKNGKGIELFVALYEYGNDGLSSKNGYIRKIVPFTQDLDKVSDELFKLKTYGGLEYCGQVIQDAVDNLEWVKNNNELKLIFIAGNEPFTQGNISYKEVCKNAIRNGILVNTIHFGNYDEGIQTMWK